MYSLILLNGGIGTRVGANQPKQLLKLRGIPILVYALVMANRVEKIDQIVLNYPPEWKESVEQVLEDYAISTPVTLVEAGDSRHSSVAAMLPHCTNENVIIHEAARPLVTKKNFEDLIEDQHANVSLMTPISFTVAPVDPDTREVTGSLERDQLRNVQLPQKFSKADLVDAHSQAEKDKKVFTEDATLVAVAGHPVYFIDGSDVNFKVTTPTDLRMAGFLLRPEEEDDD
ncbi:2-C-methyl-D-erythritol 4-phosphate cytidylyltransferase [Brachybacterium endophyticum]|uniref:2-C-methyl-D-erythritol 4-phosphate cytidylyltransferase n=1 Tax=Brachybacterium endophyticum TaxID=2182385 RepID=A0A2U2RKU0_9MICO|nr:IspD/TarI family cytidylyltransferase [Brachybacterium endophyticum]PWH06480.1 2-C-methyl-D-erythritol 4-phosphate cytidylyltransferase [Brachybacterium endophyticum]